jgi:hypothetical protein
MATASRYTSRCSGPGLRTAISHDLRVWCDPDGMAELLPTIAHDTAGDPGVHMAALEPAIADAGVQLTQVADLGGAHGCSRPIVPLACQAGKMMSYCVRREVDFGRSRGSPLFHLSINGSIVSSAR